MGYLEGKLDDKGRAFIDVIVTPSTLYREVIGIDLFKPKKANLLNIDSKYQYKAKAIIDTGATVSSIDLNVAKMLQLQTKGTTLVGSPMGHNDHDVYDVDLYLSMGNKLTLLSNKLVITSDIAQQGIHMLLGTDIIKLGKLVFDRGKRFSLDI